MKSKQTITSLAIFFFCCFFFSIIFNKCSKEDTKEEISSNQQETATPSIPQTFGPWTIQELEEEGWTKLDRIVAPNGKLSQLVIIEPYHNAEFSTNPPNKNVVFKNGGKFYLLNEDPGENKRDGLTGNRNFYFQSNTGQKEWVYIRTRPVRRF